MQAQDDRGMGLQQALGHRLDRVHARAGVDAEGVRGRRPVQGAGLVEAHQHPVEVAFQGAREDALAVDRAEHVVLADGLGVGHDGHPGA